VLSKVERESDKSRLMKVVEGEIAAERKSGKMVVIGRKTQGNLF
jgi:GTPase Era involved in 16S rRNA processing